MTYPLTKPQRLISDMERFAGGAVSNIAASLLFYGKLNMTALEQAVNAFVRTHDAMRIRITSGQMQECSTHEDEVFLKKNFEKDEDFHSWAKIYAKNPIGMHDKLYEIILISIGEEKFGTMVKLHHIIADAWSAAIFASKVNEYYKLFLNGEIPPDTQYSYFNYIEKEKQYLQSEKYKKDKKFWLEQFLQCREPVLLSEKTGSDMSSDRLSLTIDKDFTTMLRRYAKEKGLSLYSIFISAFATYLNRINSAKDFYIGTTVLNRSGTVEKKTFGIFVNTVAVPIHIETEKNFEENVKNLADVSLSVFRHQKYNYNDLLADIHDEFGFSGKLYDVLINYQNATVAGMGKDFDSTWWYHCGVQPESLQIQINDRDNKGALYIDYDYQLEKFSQADIEKLHGRLLAILNDAVNKPEKCIAELEIMPESEKNWLIRELNATDIPLPKEKCIHKYFEAAVKENPNGTALITGGKKVTYKELNTQAEGIAQILRERGINAGGSAAMLMERCDEMMPIMLGALKAGCAYMPLATSLPKDRIDYMLADSQADIIFYQESFADRFDDKITSVKTENLLDNLPACDNYTESASDPNERAYILYTSGSTGRPKGVQIEHASVVNRLLWMDSKYPLVEDETLIQKTNYAFDVSVWELFWALMLGKTLLIPRPGAEKDPKILIEYLNAEKIQKVHFVPSMLTVFLEYIAASKAEIPSLKQVIVSGEALTPALNRRFYELFAKNGTTLHNLYGPTECTVDVLYYDCDAKDTEIPIGKPVWNTGAYIIDGQGRLLPQGAAGELAISGIQLARGYVDKALDENRFVHNPLLGRIYRTGDLASVRADGEILYLGRNDFQVKIRGQRVELSEIEEQLLSYPGVSQAAVLYENERLIGFYKSEKPIKHEDISAYLIAALPSYMVPSLFVRNETFPLNANGKLAREKLLETANAVATPQKEDKKEPLAAATEQERQLLSAIKKRLGNQQIGINDNVIQAGLSSLDIISIIAELEEFGTQLSVNDFYTWETIHKLAENSGRKDRPLIHVYNSCENADTAMLCIPYGGGSFGSFADLAAAFNEHAQTPLIAARSAHISPDVLLKAIKELPYKNYILLGCCVGSALTIETAKLIEKEKGYTVQAVFLLSSIPPAGVNVYGNFLNPWNFSSPNIINRYLQGLSEKDFRLGLQEITQFRSDVGHFLKYLANNKKTSINAPVFLIYGDSDPMLKGKKIRKQWEKYINIADEKQIAGAKHYLIHTHVQELCAYILSTI